MAKLYKKVQLLVSKHYYHGGDGVEIGPHCFFRSLDEYEMLAHRHDWESGGSTLKTSWCVRPKQIEAHVDPKVYAKFLNSGELRLAQVLFSADKLAEIREIGCYQSRPYQ